MSPSHDAARLDLRGAFDLAIMVEEDAQLRYERYAQLVGDDPGGAGEIFRTMAANEARHRSDLHARRDAVFRDAPRRIEISVLEAAALALEVDEPELPRTAREALRLALASEQRSFDFYRDALTVVDDPGVRYFFQQLMDEEAEHLAAVAARLARVEAAPVFELPAPAPPPARRLPLEPYLDRARVEAVLPRFDAATQAVASRVLLTGLGEDEVAASLGVSPRTVALKLARFVQLARAPGAFPD